MPEYKPLPSEVQELCRAVNAPPRLIAHLTLVHDVADTLARRIRAAFPEAIFDADNVLFGAAVHDLGKAICRTEIVAPGNDHERAGVQLLRQHGVSEERARFAYTHANWEPDCGCQLEDLLVALADNCWKGKRVAQLEQQTVQYLKQKTAWEEWEVFLRLDEILQELASSADERLAWQASFPPNEALNS